MYCPNCGNKLKHKTCSNCNFHLKDGSFFKKILVFLIIILIVVVTFIFINKINLSWDESYEDNNLTLVTSSTLTLGIKTDLNSDDLSVNVSCGEYTKSDLEIKWDLTKSTGKCHIEVTYKFKKIVKDVEVVSYNLDNELSLEYEIDLDSDEDLDFDGLTNKQEKEYKTNPELYDTDMDGLDDYYEIFTSKTDPNKKDSDDDGLSDYDEIKLGLNPLKSDSKGDGIKDGNRTLTYDYSNDDVKISIKGKGNIANITAKVTEDTKISNKNGMINKLYSLYTDGKIDTATLTLNYTLEELKQYNIDEDNLTLFYFNTNEDKYEKVDTTIDKENKTITSVLNHFSNYVIGDKEKVKEKVSSQILFVIDNSWSMYSSEQYEKIVGKPYDPGLFGVNILTASDASGKRFDLTSSLSSKLIKKGNKIGISEFRYDYANGLKIGSSEEEIKNFLNNMDGNFITKREGTNITNAISNGLNEFSSSDSNYIIVLTDGQDNSLSLKIDSIVKKALNKNVKVCTIGFGEGVTNKNLANLANATGCKFFSSSDSNGLIELFDNLQVEVSNDLVDTNNDEINDGIVIADSGFIVNRDGFSFGNYGTNYSSGGHCYGMATFAQLYYQKLLPLKFAAKTNGDMKSYAYDLNNIYFNNYPSLYDYKLKTNDLKYTFGFEYFNEKTPSDYREISGNVFKINEKYRSTINTGLYDILKIELSKEQLKKYDFEYYEEVLLNEDKIQNNNKINVVDRNLLNAIYAAFAKQNGESRYSSGSNFLLWLRQLVGSESIDYKGKEGFINVLTTRLKNGDPIVLVSNFCGMHAINAISLIQDSDNPNYYKIAVYDNNYPGEKRYVDLECNDKTCVTKANEYYSNSNEPIRITVSLEQDLEYYN